MLTRRLIACLDVDGGRVVKGTRFEELQVLGSPAAMACGYERDGADEIVFLDICASAAGRPTLLQEVRQTAEVLTIPLTVGGGVRSEADMAATLRAGADKVAVNSAAVADPALITRAAARFGAQCVVVSIDARRGAHGWEVVTHGGRRPTSLDALEWAAQVATLGAGELLLTSIDRDGTREGYDIELLAQVAARVQIPVVASGGAGDPKHLVQALTAGAADAVLLAGMLHRGETTVAALKAHLLEAGLPIRRTAQETHAAA
jgi:imidazole glycerol-phosphate synthase subunit HisF